MRNDAGINGDAQRIEQIAWMLFLKIYDAKETDWEFEEKNYKSIIPANCRWSAWAHDGGNRNALTGGSLLEFVNNTLFDKHRTSQWTDAYMLYILFLGLLLLPITLLFVFFDIPIDKTTLFVAFVYLLGKLLLLYKCLRIFFYKKGGFFHLILYFCTLEIIPALALWRVLVYVSQILITYI